MEDFKGGNCDLENKCRLEKEKDGFRNQKCKFRNWKGKFGISRRRPFGNCYLETTTEYSVSGKVLAQVWNLTAQIRGEDSETNTASSETNAADSVKMPIQNDWSLGVVQLHIWMFAVPWGANLGTILDIIWSLWTFQLNVKFHGFGTFDIIWSLWAFQVKREVPHSLEFWYHLILV